MEISNPISREMLLCEAYGKDDGMRDNTGDITLPELTKEQEAVVEHAFQPFTSDEVLVNGFKMEITRSDIATISKYNWLNDEVRILGIHR